jgi:hypothetical protein
MPRLWLGDSDGSLAGLLPDISSDSFPMSGSTMTSNALYPSKQPFSDPLAV